jgi:hypothetical protein
MELFITGANWSQRKRVSRPRARAGGFSVYCSGNSKNFLECFKIFCREFVQSAGAADESRRAGHGQSVINNLFTIDVDSRGRAQLICCFTADEFRFASMT